MRILFIFSCFIFSFHVFGQNLDTIRIQKDGVTVTVFLFENESIIPKSKQETTFYIHLVNANSPSQIVSPNRKTKQLAKDLVQEFSALEPKVNKNSTVELFNSTLFQVSNIDLSTENHFSVINHADLPFLNSTLQFFLSNFSPESPIFQSSHVQYEWFAQSVLPQFKIIQDTLIYQKEISLSQNIWEGDYGLKAFLLSEGWLYEYQEDPEFLPWKETPLRNSKYSVSFPKTPDLQVLPGIGGRESSIYRVIDRKGRIFECANYKIKDGIDQFQQIMKGSIQESLRNSKLQLSEISPIFKSPSAQYQDVIFENPDRQTVTTRVFTTENDVIILKLTYIPTEESNALAEYFLNSILISSGESKNIQIPIHNINSLWPRFPVYFEIDKAIELQAQLKSNTLSQLIVPATVMRFSDFTKQSIGTLISDSGKLNYYANQEGISVVEAKFTKEETQYFLRIEQIGVYYVLRYISTKDSDFLPEAIEFINQ